MQLTPSQHAALALDKNISVTAGAGSGKTRILVDRFLKIVSENPDLTKRTVAITFTEKAAAEMQERIAQEVSDRIQSKDITPPERKKLQSIRDQLGSAYISTIHGFSMRLLQEFPIEANVTPDFGVLEPIRQQVFIHSAIRTVMETLDKSAHLDKETDWLTFFIALPRYRIEEMLRVALAKPYEIQTVAESYCKRSKEEYISFITEEWFKHFYHVVSPEQMQQSFELIKNILKLDTAETKSEKALELLNILEVYQENFASNRNSVQTCSSFLKLADAFTTNDARSYSNLAHLGKKESWSVQAVQSILELSEMLSPVQQQIIRVNPGSPPDETDEKWYNLFLVFLKLYNQVAENYRKIKDEQGVLDFEDLQLKTLQLLKENEAIRKKLHLRFKYVMVDEFQDTNPVQWQIVEMLNREEHKLADDKVFFVGDPKQSIYGFRDADIRIFNHVTETFAAHSGQSETNIIFRESFRFLPKLNAFINFFFSQILKRNSENPFEVAYDELSAQRNIENEGSIEIALFDEDSNQSEAEYIALKINNLIKDNKQVYEGMDGTASRGLRFGDIAILLRDRSSLSDIEYTLRANNIPFKTVGGVGFWQRQEIYDIYHVLRFLANPADDLALVALLRSRLFLLPDNVIFFMSDNEGNGFLEKLKLLQNDYRISPEEKEAVEQSCMIIQKWLKLRERINLGELLNIILDDTKLFAMLNAEFSGEQRTANLQKIVELAESFDQSGPGGMKGFLDIIDDLINREVSEGEALLALDDTESVKIMTIHVSKGLQFPVVFTPFLNRGLRGGANDVLIDSELGMAVSYRSEDDGEDNDSENTLYRLLQIRQKQKDIAENKRIFYVAVSRASDYLFLSASSRNKKIKENSMLELFSACFKEEITELNPGMIVYDDFEINLVTEYNQPGEKETSTISFKKMIEQLRSDSGIALSQDIKLAQQIPVETYGRMFSATALMTYLKDPDEYYRHYHLGFFEGDYEQGILAKQDDIDSLLKGKIVHRFLELYDPKNSQEIIERILFDFEIYDHKIIEKLKSELIQIQTRISQSVNGQKILLAKEFKNEVSLTMLLGDDFFTGTIDRLQKNDAGDWEVYDYKTNLVRESDFLSIASQYDIQMQSYALLLSHLYPSQEEHRIVLYFLTIGKFFEKIYKKEEIINIENSFIKTINEIKNRFPVI